MSTPTLVDLAALHGEAQGALSLAQSVAHREPYHANGLAKSAERLKWETQNAIAQEKFKDAGKALTDAFSRANYPALTKPLDKGGLDEAGNRLAAERSLAPRSTGVHLSRESTASDAEMAEQGRRQGDAWRVEALAARGIVD